MTLQDSTLLIVKSLDWFVFGLFTFLFLALIKIHLLTRIQPRVYSNVLSPDKPLQNYFKFFVADLKPNSGLYRSVWRYLIKYNEKEWPESENKKIRAVVSMLTGLTTFLKPYLVVAFIFVILKVWVSVHFFFDELSISLGAIQRMLAQLSSIGFVSFLGSYKALIIFIYATVCLVIPWLYDKKTMTKSIKKYFTLSLGYASIVLSISFFGSGLGEVTSRKGEELAKLEMEVISVHDKIFSKIGKSIIIGDFEEEVVRHDESLTSEYRETESYVEEYLRDYSDSLYLVKLPFELKAKMWLKHLEQSLILPGFAMPPGPKPEDAFHTQPAGPGQRTNKEFPSYHTINNYRTDKSPPATEADQYFANNKNWNKKVGEELLGATEQAATKTTVKESSKKFQAMIDIILDFGLDKTASAFLEYFDLQEHKTIKKFAEVLFSEGYKKSLSDRILKTAAAIKAAFKKPISLVSVKKPGEGLFTKDDVDEIKKQNMNEWNSRKTSARQEQAALAKQKAALEQAQREQQRLLREQMEKADAYLAGISMNSRWERIRARAYANINSYEGFSYQQKLNFKAFLRSWDDYKAANKLGLYSRGETNLENLFYEFSNQDAMRKACWGFMLQQEDWNGAVDYYTRISPDPKAKGQPYFFIQYYLAQTNRKNHLTAYYDEATNIAVGTQCPPTH